MEKNTKDEASVASPNVPAKPIPGFLKREENLFIDCQVQLPSFEGPLDLLLHLIKNHELDILNLPIAQITKQYLSYLDYMREMNLDLASDYLVMAATLIYLKSRVILPQEESTEATGPDPRAQLIRRLMELKNYKELSQMLAARPRLFRDVFLCKNTGAEEIELGLEPEVALTNPYQLVEAYRLMTERRKQVVHNVVNDEVPILSCVTEIVEQLRHHEHISFMSLMPPLTKPQHLISYFLGVLETARMGFIGIEQDEIFGPISVRRRGEIADLDNAADRIRGLSWG